MLGDTLQKVETSDAMKTLASRLTRRSRSDRSPARFAERSMPAHDKARFKLHSPPLRPQGIRVHHQSRRRDVHVPHPQGAGSLTRINRNGSSRH